MTGGRFADCRSSRPRCVNGSQTLGATKEANLPAGRQSAIKTGTMTGGRVADCRSSRLRFVDGCGNVRGRRRRRICRPPVRVQSTQHGGLYSEAMTKWEYVTVPLLVHATKQILDNWGQDGWELVQVVPGLNPENLVAYLKRPVPAPGAGA
jgi:hypothetical protein